MGLRENMLAEPVSRLPLRDPLTASRQATIREAVALMRQGKLGCVIVVDDDRRPIGMFTENMLTQMLAAANVAALNEAVASHMAEQWPWVKLTDPIFVVLEAMQAKNVRFLCVVDEDGRVAALTGQKGLMEYVADHFPRQVMVQRIGGTPYQQEREGA